MGCTCRERDDVTSRPLSTPNMPKTVFCPGVFSFFVLPSSLPCCLSFHPVYFADSFEKNCSTYIKQHSPVKLWALRERRSSHLVPATGLHWFLYHIGLVSCVSFYFLTIPQLLKIVKKVFFARLTRKYLLTLSILSRMYCNSSPFSCLYHANDKKGLTFYKCV